jgi:hypothetical protein
MRSISHATNVLSSYRPLFVNAAQTDGLGPLRLLLLRCFAAALRSSARAVLVIWWEPPNLFGGRSA